MQETGLEILTISQLTRRVKNLLEEQVGEVWLSGEISNCRVVTSGHAYFTLKDANSQIDAVMFKGSISKMRFKPESGLEVLARGRITVYEPRGNYQIVLSEMQPKGLGALQFAYEKLKRKLEDEGLFDARHKKPLPMLPKRIGVVTSRTGAAIRDILNVLNRRFSNVHVIVYPVRVQGEGAAAEIAEGIATLERFGVDVMIVGRGGGSLEDLWPFNEEIVARAIFAAQTPIISAVGHEIDFALSDFVADVRAPTPSAAAELVVQEQEALAERVQNLQRRMARTVKHDFDRARHRIAVLQQSFLFRRPDELLRQKRQACDELRQRMDAALEENTAAARLRLERAQRTLNYLSPAVQVRAAMLRLRVAQKQLRTHGQDLPERHRSRMRPVVAALEALSPLAILSRGFALAKRAEDGALVRSAAQLKKGGLLDISFGSGGVLAEIREIRK